MTRSRLILILAVMALVLTLPSVVSAQRLPPHVFVAGTIDGAMPVDGTVITAMVNDAEVATATVVDGKFTLVVDQGDQSFAGMMVHFTVDGMEAMEAPAWEQGGGTELNLTIAVEPGRVVTIDLAELNESGQSGTATLTEMGSNTQVVLSLSEGTLQTELVHIHLGQCGDSLGGVDQALTSFIGGSGDSTTVVPVTLASLMDGDHAVNSHEAGNAGNYTSCGNIPSSIAATVATAWSGLSQYLVDDRGMSLYLFTRDTQGTDSTAPVATCTSDGCMGAWPPLWTAGDPVAMEQPEFRDGANADMLGTLEWADGNVQVTYNGWPVYYYFKDLAPGDVTGQYGPWFLLAPQGTLLVGGTNVDPVGPGAGPQGETGARGATGSKGDKGDTGSAGSDGSAGRAGAAGSAGATGPAGADGAGGSAGPDGSPGAAGSAGADGDDGSSTLAIVALILAIISLLGAGGVFFLRRGT